MPNKRPKATQQYSEALGPFRNELYDPIPGEAALHLKHLSDLYGNGPNTRLPKGTFQQRSEELMIEFQARRQVEYRIRKEVLEKELADNKDSDTVSGQNEI